ncbi:MAG: putative selenium-dependent hydroxylase accessory protein YqeC [Nitrospinota bacterium]|nr:MAG: putative selenium-dependent hydroxylase accessory protein YqeC [Nitrospinota bacterium]
MKPQQVVKVPQLSTFLDFAPGLCISIMGAGGKATLLHRLADELTVLGHTVVLSSTTNFHRPSYLLPEQILLIREVPRWPERLRELARQWNRLLVLHHDLGDDMVKGIDVAAVRKIQQQIPYAIVLLKTDGARKRWFKAPSPSEPVIPPWSQICIMVVSVEILGHPLTDTLVHRPEQVQRLTGLQENAPITPEVVGTVLTHPTTYAAKIPPTARRVIYISHVQSPADLEQARAIAACLDWSAVDCVLAGDTPTGRFYALNR